MKHLLDKATPVWAIHALNAALIAVLLVGVPSITGVRLLGSLRLSSDYWLQRLLLAGLGLGVLLNLLMGWWCRPRRQRTAYRGWTLLHAGLLAVAVLTYSGRIHFDWLDDSLRQLRRVRFAAPDTVPPRPTDAPCLAGPATSLHQAPARQDPLRRLPGKPVHDPAHGSG